MKPRLDLGGLSNSQLSAWFRKSGGREGVMSILKGESEVRSCGAVRAWHANDITRFTVVGTAHSGNQLATLLTGWRLTMDAETTDLLAKTDMPALENIASDVAVISSRTTSENWGVEAAKKIASEKNFRQPPLQLAFQARHKFTDVELSKMVFRRIIFVHAPIIDDSGDECMLMLDLQNGAPTLKLLRLKSAEWTNYDGFAFLESQISVARRDND